MQQLKNVLDNMINIKSDLQKKSIATEINSSDNKMTSKINVEQCFYDNSYVNIKLNEKEDTLSLKLNGFPVTEFHSILSIVVPLIPRLLYYTEKSEAATITNIADMIEKLVLCEKILTVRQHLTNIELLPDWNNYFEPTPPNNVFINIFPFRDSMYTTVYLVSETRGECRELHSYASPFHLLPNSIVSINGKMCLIENCIVASQNLQLLAQTLRLIRSSIEELEIVLASKRKELKDEYQ